jgi:transcriptional regulator with XRE-family HTH domain
VKERIRKLRESLKLDRSEFEAETGIKAKTWANVENGIQRANEEHIKAIIERWPMYAYWLTTGKTIPEAGQISPEIEEVRRNLGTGT